MIFSVVLLSACTISCRKEEQKATQQTGTMNIDYRVKVLGIYAGIVDSSWTVAGVKDSVQWADTINLVKDPVYSDFIVVRNYSRKLNTDYTFHSTTMSYSGGFDFYNDSTILNLNESFVISNGSVLVKFHGKKN